MVSDADFPARGSGREKLGFAVRQAMQRSEPQHWHSAEFFVREQFVEVLAHESGGVAVFDPEGRDRMIHCGVALQRLKVVLKRHGCFGRVDLFPDLDQPNLAARVHIGCGGARTDDEQQLSRAMAEEGSLQQCPTTIFDASWDWLGRAANNERSWLEFARCEESRQLLMELVRSPVSVRRAKIQVQNETTTGSAHRRWKLIGLTSGILHERLVRWRKPTLAVKVDSPSAPEMFQVNQLEAPEGTYAVLKTKTDDKHGWLAAGQALGVSMLHARTLGLPCTPLLSGLHRSELRAELRTAIGHKGFMQVIMCFGAPRAGLPPRANELYAMISSRASA